jgi:LysM repeat protein
MMRKLWAGELGPKKDMEHFPDLRKDMLHGNVDLATASYFEKLDKTTMGAITPADIDIMEIEGKSRNEMGSLRNQVRTVKAESVKKTMTDEEAFSIGQSIKGGSDKTAGLDDLADIAPLIASVSGIAGPQVALAIAAAKILAEESQKRQKEADDLLLQNEEMAKQARDESLALMEKLSLDFAEPAKAELIEKIATVKIMVTASDTFKAIGKNFKGPEALYDTLNSNALVLPATKGGGVIESYKTDEDLVASVSGGLALHGLVLVLEAYPVVAGAVPALKRPEHV